MPEFFDIHSHVSFSDFDTDRAEVISRMKEKAVWTITVGCDRASSKKAVETAELYDNVFATVGVHPADNHEEIFDVEFYRTLLKHKKVVAVGECGIDYFRVKGAERTLMPPGYKDDEVRINEKKRQVELFKRQIELALEFDKPLMIHGRPSPRSMDAYEDILEVLTPYSLLPNSRLRGNVHFFAGNLEIAKKFIDLGFTLSFTGVITFTPDYDEVVKATPLEMIMAETDCPFVTPVPHRGTRNEPVYVEEVVKRIAELRGEDLEVVKKAMVWNALRAFGIGS